MAKNTSISLGPHFEAFFQRMIATGRYATTSDVVRAGLRLLESEELKHQALSKALEEGEASGMVDGFDPEALIESLNETKRNA